MRRTPSGTTRQLGLLLEANVRNQPVEEIHELLIQALADLLLEAYSEENDRETRVEGDRDEPKDRT